MVSVLNGGKRPSENAHFVLSDFQSTFYGMLIQDCEVSIRKCLYENSFIMKINACLNETNLPKCI